MKKILKVTLIFALIFLQILALSGCSSNKKDNTVVTIRSYYQPPESMKDKNSIILQGAGSGEYLEVSVRGKIFNFKNITLSWDENKMELIEEEIINQLEEVENKIIILETYLPEGIPQEKITWELSDGEKFEHLVAEDGKGN